MTEEIDKLEVASVEAFQAVIDDAPEDARLAIRGLSARDKAVLAFYAQTLSDLVLDEMQMASSKERRAAHVTFDPQFYPG